MLVLVTVVEGIEEREEGGEVVSDGDSGGGRRSSTGVRRGRALHRGIMAPRSSKLMAGHKNCAFVVVCSVLKSISFIHHLGSFSAVPFCAAVGGVAY